MKNVDLSPLISCDATYERTSTNVSEKYNCAWDDAVHDSFWRFVSQIKENGRKLHDIRTSTELLEKAVDAHNVDALQSKSLALVKEAEAL